MQLVSLLESYTDKIMLQRKQFRLLIILILSLCIKLYDSINLKPIKSINLPNLNIINKNFNNIQMYNMKNINFDFNSVNINNILNKPIKFFSSWSIINNDGSKMVPPKLPPSSDKIVEWSKNAINKILHDYKLNIEY